MRVIKQEWAEVFREPSWYVVEAGVILAYNQRAQEIGGTPFEVT
jgi:hypothetical protein